MKTENYIECKICGKITAVSRLPSFGGNLVKCTECRMVFKNPMPLEALKKYYKNYYSNFFSAKKIESHRNDIYFHFFKSELNRNAKGRLLDIGCGLGTFLSLAQKQGWETFGTELSEEASQFAQKKQGLNVFCGDLKKASYLEESFDVITLWNVLDHMENPLAELFKMKKILRKGGVLFIRLPNFLFQRNIDRLSRWIERLFSNRINLSKKISVSHFYSFTPSSIEQLLRQAGFSNFRIKNAHPTKGDPYEVFPFLGDKLMDKIKWCYFLFIQFLSLISIGKILWSTAIEIYSYKE